MIICGVMDPDPLKKEYLQAMRGITSTVTVISAANGLKKHAMTATSVTSLSLNPPSILVCINREALIHKVIVKDLFFCINILGSGQEDLADICSIKDKEELRFQDRNWSEDDSVPYNKACKSNLFCRCIDSFDYKTHTIFIGEITKVIRNNEGDPLLYKDGNYLG